ncbi:hypothetical protein MKP07_08650 [Niabella hibiscisoli]|nr:hypothetical protein [Niabella hibiscisoli]MCH5716264.1 hypothetical protein [Niabella hibiscisoli]
MDKTSFYQWMYKEWFGIIIIKGYQLFCYRWDKGQISWIVSARKVYRRKIYFIIGAILTYTLQLYRVSGKRLMQLEQ